jgi:subfamily B ATP-binding cassette protein HlyB/CyaB
VQTLTTFFFFGLMVRRSDHIVTIERGRVVEQGSHQDLLRAGGRYASLHSLLAGLDEIA